MSIQPLGNEAQNSRFSLVGSVASTVAILNRPTEAAGLQAQLESYSTLAGRWPQLSERDRPAAAQALGESRFAQRIQSTLNAFTRAAWAGPDAAPPAPEKQILAAFGALSPPDQQIVAALQGGALGVLPLTSADDYHAKLRSDVDAAEAAAVAPARRPDMITLSDAALARLQNPAPAASASPPTMAPQQPRSAQMAAALAVYEKTAG